MPMGGVRMKHDELQEDLARHLRGNTDRMVWTNTQLGPAASPRPDVFTVDKSYARFAADAYEIKVSVSDLRHDITSGKWQSYRKFAHRVWFAYPRGMVPIDEIPRECGVILRNETGWRTARKPVAQVLDTLPRDAWLKLLIESFPNSAVGHRKEPRQANEWSVIAALRAKYGKDVAELFESRKAADRAFEYATIRRKAAAEETNAETEAMKERARKEVERIHSNLDEAMKHLGESLGLKPEDITATSLATKLREVQRILGQTYNLSASITQLQALQEFIKNQKSAA